jgi:hypothetical protein
VTVQAVDVDRGTVTINVFGRQGSQDKTYLVTRDAPVTLDGKAARLADVKAGAAVLLTVSADDASTVIQIQ